MSAASDRLEQQLDRLDGGTSMPATKTVDVKNKAYAVKTEVEQILLDIQDAPNGLLIGGAAYSVVKEKFRTLLMKNEALEVDPDTDYYIKSRWLAPGADMGVIVDYRVPAYTNSVGKTRNVKRLTIVSA